LATAARVHLELLHREVYSLRLAVEAGKNFALLIHMMCYYKENFHTVKTRKFRRIVMALRVLDWD